MSLKKLFEIFKAPRGDILSDEELEASKREHAELVSAYERWKEKNPHAKDSETN